MEKIYTYLIGAVNFSAKSHFNYCFEYDKPFLQTKACIQMEVAIKFIANSNEKSKQTNT